MLPEPPAPRGWLGQDRWGGVPSETRPDHRPPPHWRLEDVYATPRPHHLAASPDGTTVGFVLDLEGTSDLWTVSVAAGEPRRLTTGRALTAYWEDAAPAWSPGGEALAYQNGDEVWVVPAAGGPPRRLGPGSLGCWLDSDRLAVLVDRDGCSRLCIVGLEDPWPTPLGPKDGDLSRPLPLADGRILAKYFPKEDLSRSDIVVIEPGGAWTTLAGEPDRRTGGHAVKENRVAYLHEEEDWVAVYLVDLEDGAHRLLAAGECDYSDLVWDGDGLVALATARGRTDLVRVSAEGEVCAVLEGGVCSSPVATGAGIVVVQETPSLPPRVLLVDRDGISTTLYDGAPAPVRKAPHAKQERVVFRSGDGMEMEGFLYRPEDVTVPVPAVVYPHGGPTSHYGEEWDGHAQYFVDKGYAWLAINFRGSTSYGLGFERANHGVWGVADVEDCIASARYLAGLGWVDPQRIAVYGASYGAYLALAALVHPENPFACGVAKYGDCDILTSWAQGDRVGREDLERMMGHPSRAREAYRLGSPIGRIEGIERPILVAHGELDRRVHPRQSEQLVAALDRIGATYEYVTYPTEGHGLLRREPQIHFYRRLERFLDWYLL